MTAASIGRAIPATRVNSTRALLTCGIVAGPLFLFVSIMQAVTREGFDIRKVAFSSLSLGDLGWIQISNFIVAGLLSLACAVGMRRVLHPGPAGTWGPLLLGIYGIGQIGAGIFTTDPAMGFPPGTPDGLPEHFTWHAIAHNISAPVAFLSASIACFVLVRRFVVLGRKGWVAYSLTTGILAPIIAMPPDPGTAGIRLALFSAMVYLWVAILAASLKQELKQS